MNNKIVELYDLIKRNNPADWSDIDSLLNVVFMDLDDVLFDIIYETLAQSCHWGRYYEEWC